MSLVRVTVTNHGKKNIRVRASWEERITLTASSSVEFDTDDISSDFRIDLDKPEEKKR